MNHTIASSAKQRFLGAAWFGVWGFLAAGALAGRLLHLVGRGVG